LEKIGKGICGERETSLKLISVQIFSLIELYPLNAYYKDYLLVARRLNLKTEITNPFFEKIIIAATINIDSKRRRGVALSHVPTRFAFLFATSAILLLLSSLLVIQINQSAGAGRFPRPNGR
jgi:hypothetical protein